MAGKSSYKTPELNVVNISANDIVTQSIQKQNEEAGGVQNDVFGTFSKQFE